MSNTVKLTKEQGDALQGLMTGRGSWDRVNIVSNHAKGPNWSTKECDCLNGLPLDFLIRALYIGYEVEQTVEEKLREQYRNWSEDDGFDHAAKCGMETTLDIIGMEVKGINA